MPCKEESLKGSLIFLWISYIMYTYYPEGESWGVPEVCLSVCLCCFVHLSVEISTEENILRDETISNNKVREVEEKLTGFPFVCMNFRRGNFL